MFRQRAKLFPHCREFLVLVCEHKHCVFFSIPPFVNNVKLMFKKKTEKGIYPDVSDIIFVEIFRLFQIKLTHYYWCLFAIFIWYWILFLTTYNTPGYLWCTYNYNLRHLLCFRFDLHNIFWQQQSHVSRRYCIAVNVYAPEWFRINLQFWICFLFISH